MNDYYDPRLKRARLERLVDRPGFTFEQLDLADRSAAPALFATARPVAVVHLAAQAGVRYSLENPNAYVDANLADWSAEVGPDPAQAKGTRVALAYRVRF